MADKTLAAGQGSKASQEQHHPPSRSSFGQVTSMMQVHNIMDEWFGPDPGMTEEEEMEAYEEEYRRYNLNEADDEEIYQELVYRGMSDNLDWDFDRVLRHARQAAKAGESLYDYLERIGVELTDNEEDAADALLRKFYWEQSGQGTEPKDDMKSASIKVDASLTTGQDEEESLASSGKMKEDTTPQQPTSTQPEVESQKSSNEAAWEAAAQNGFPLPERRDGTIIDAAVKPSAEQLALLQQLSPEQAAELWTILRFVYEAMDGVADAPAALRRAGIKSTDSRVQIVMHAVIRLMGDTFSPISLGDFWSAIEPSERETILAVKVQARP